MTGNTYILGVILLIVGTVCICILRKWSERGLSSKDKHSLKTIQENYHNFWIFIVIGIVVNIPTIFSTEDEIISSNIFWALIFCVFSIFIVFQDQNTRKKLILAGIPRSFRQTDDFIGNMVPILFVVVGIIFLFS